MIGLLFSAKWTIYQLYHGKNKLHFLLDQLAELDLRVLVRWNNNPRERIILNHNQLALALYFLVMLQWRIAEKQQLPILKFLVWADRGPKPRSTALEKNTLIITPRMWITNTDESKTICF
jgi:hypothetical protein